MMTDVQYCTIQSQESNPMHVMSGNIATESFNMRRFDIHSEIVLHAQAKKFGSWHATFFFFFFFCKNEYQGVLTLPARFWYGCGKVFRMVVRRRRAKKIVKE